MPLQPQRHGQQAVQTLNSKVNNNRTTLNTLGLWPATYDFEPGPLRARSWKIHIRIKCMVRMRDWHRTGQRCENTRQRRCEKSFVTFRFITQLRPALATFLYGRSLRSKPRVLLLERFAHLILPVSIFQ